MTRTAISPRLAIRTFVSTRIWLRAWPGTRARAQLAGGRFADVRWVAETDSTNADALDLARDGAPEGIVVVADHQTAGRGRPGPHVGGAARGRRCWCRCCSARRAAVVATCHDGGRRWPRPRRSRRWPASRPGSSGRTTWCGRATARADRKLAGILAEAEWPPGDVASGRAAGPGSGPWWSSASASTWTGRTSCPSELADIAVALQPRRRARRRPRGPARRPARSGSTTHDRRSAPIGPTPCWPSGGPGRPPSAAGCGSTSAPTTSWAPRSTSTDAGHLVVDTDDGERTVVAVGDVVHLR